MCQLVAVSPQPFPASTAACKSDVGLQENYKVKRHQREERKKKEGEDRGVP